MKKIQIFVFLFVSMWMFSQSYDLKLNLEKGKSYEMMQRVDLDMLQKVQGQEIPMKMGAVVALTAKVDSKDKDTYKLETTYTFVESVFEGMGQKVKLDSDMKEDNEIIDVFKALTGKPFFIYLTEKGKVTKIEGNKEILDGIIKEFADNQLVKQGQILSMYNDETIIQMFSMIYNFPEKAVKVGETWNADFLTTAPYKLNNQTSFNLKEVDNYNYSISFSSNMKSLPNQVMESSGYKVSPDLSGTGKGEIKLNKKTGWIAGQNSEGDMNGTISMVDMGGMKIDLTMKMKTSYTPQSKYMSPPPPMETKQK